MSEFDRETLAYRVAGFDRRSHELGDRKAAAVALVVMAPHLVWLVRNDFLPFAYASARAAPSRGVLDHVLHPAVFLVSQLTFLLPALAIAAIKRCVHVGGELPLANGLALEAELMEQLFKSKDANEGLHAFVEKRKPTFVGR